ncbi:hypothetical protein chiPu_0008176 [Chiloscyllium punctatum]|uniref:Uncharacterized protein n=1 Tax=Chiloscyllium punctatum TaxID=137246 RepID=A0A401SH82_CHIPU|nr:hypothetical protein [Chiloscyllium punctatum]
MNGMTQALCVSGNRGRQRRLRSQAATILLHAARLQVRAARTPQPIALIVKFRRMSMPRRDNYHHVTTEDVLSQKSEADYPVLAEYLHY